MARELFFQPQAHLSADLLVETEPRGVSPGGRPGVRGVNVGLAQILRVPVNDPLRLAESSWIAIVGLYPRPGHVEAEVTDDARKKAGAATSGTSDQQQVFTHAMFPSRFAPVAQSNQHPGRRGVRPRRPPRPVALLLSRRDHGASRRCEHYGAPEARRYGGGVR